MWNVSFRRHARFSVASSNDISACRLLRAKLIAPKIPHQEEELCMSIAMGSSRPQACLVISAFLVLITLTSARAYPWFANRESITTNNDADVSIPQDGITTNATLANGNFDITCSGEHFGLSPNVEDCHSARRQFPSDVTQRTWGQRHTGLSEPYFPLPYRVMGGELYTP